MDNDRIAINIRVTQDFIDKMDEHIKRINEEDSFGRRLSRSMFIRSSVEQTIKGAQDGR